jgi:hypothetical protein
MKISTEQDCLQAHITLIAKVPRGRNRILRTVKQRLASLLIALRFRPENRRADRR